MDNFESLDFGILATSTTPSTAPYNPASHGAFNTSNSSADGSESHGPVDFESLPPPNLPAIILMGFPSTSSVATEPKLSLLFALSHERGRPPSPTHTLPTAQRRNLPQKYPPRLHDVHKDTRVVVATVETAPASPYTHPDPNSNPIYRIYASPSHSHSHHFSTHEFSSTAHSSRPPIFVAATHTPSSNTLSSLSPCQGRTRPVPLFPVYALYSFPPPYNILLPRMLCLKIQDTTSTSTAIPSATNLQDAKFKASFSADPSSRSV
ncbi:hypothetical protein R3P38DRAFT_3291810 [Favolaschia claudopus]|uniref:Uncharacterized protein n=1 Tax=Favolaschia claudopus TaxID=2862362 RepID=A0AAV9ZMZ5_9AGAR